MKWYKCVSVYGWYTKVIEKIRQQKLRYMKRYTKILVYERYTSQKKPYEVIYRPFFSRDRFQINNAVMHFIMA